MKTKNLEKIIRNMEEFTKKGIEGFDLHKFKDNQGRIHMIQYDTISNYSISRSLNNGILFTVLQSEIYIEEVIEYFEVWV